MLYIYICTNTYNCCLVIIPLVPDAPETLIALGGTSPRCRDSTFLSRRIV